jgi:hypothetical protein
VRYMIIYIPIKSSSNEIKSSVIIFIPLQLTLGHVVERRRDHVHLLYDLLNSTTLTQKIVTGSALPITEILTIEEHKLDNTFFHVAFESQSLLNSSSDQTSSDSN